MDDDDFDKRINEFRLHSLSHAQTLDLVNDLWREIRKLRAQLHAEKLTVEILKNKLSGPPEKRVDSGFGDF